jgi:hypothetical protein
MMLLYVAGNLTKNDVSEERSIFIFKGWYALYEFFSDRPAVTYPAGNCIFPTFQRSVEPSQRQNI